MSAAVFDTNVFYNVHHAVSNGAYLRSSGVFVAEDGAPYGSAFLSPYNSSNPKHPWSWQFYQSSPNSDQYVVRTADNYGSPPTWLCALQTSTLHPFGCNDTCSETTVAITNLTDASSFWSVIPSGDGQTYYLSNAANGSDWYLAVDDTGDNAGSWLNMGNTEGSKTQMAFEFSSVAQINDNAFSTLAPSFASLSSSSSSSSRPDQLSPTPASSVTSPIPTGFLGSSVGGQPSPPHANVGAAVGGAFGALAALVLLVVAGLWLWRRCRKPLPHSSERIQRVELGVALEPKEAAADNDILEISADGQVVEAPASNQRRGLKHHTTSSNESKVYELAATDKKTPT